MESKLAKAVGLKTHALAITWADEAPSDALRFKPGAWGCVVSLFAAVAAKGKTAAFDRETYGCWGGGVGLGFGNQYECFPGGVECFCGFLSNGNDRTEKGRAVFQQCSSWMLRSPRSRIRPGAAFWNSSYARTLRSPT